MIEKEPFVNVKTSWLPWLPRHILQALRLRYEHTMIVDESFQFKWSEMTWYVLRLLDKNSDPDQPDQRADILIARPLTLARARQIRSLEKRGLLPQFLKNNFFIIRVDSALYLSRRERMFSDYKPLSDEDIIQLFSSIEQIISSGESKGFSNIEKLPNRGWLDSFQVIIISFPLMWFACFLIAVVLIGVSGHKGLNTLHAIVAGGVICTAAISLAIGFERYRFRKILLQKPR